MKLQAKRNGRAFAEIQMGLEIVIQSELSQTEKNKYCIISLTKVESGIQKTGTDELVCKSEIETQMQRKHYECQGGEEDELGDWDN